MTNYFILPGLGNSGENHWQTFFEKQGGNFKRIDQKEWDAPDCNDWLNTINTAIESYDPATIVFIAHSLACSTVAHWATKFNTKIKGALLVSPSDIEAPHYDFKATGFVPIPLNKLHFKTIVVASTNDYWVTIERATFFADSWGSEFINIGDAGHINAEAGFGQWNEGLDILKMLG